MTRKQRWGLWLCLWALAFYNNPAALSLWIGCAFMIPGAVLLTGKD